MEKIKDLTMLQNYSDKWIALSSDESKVVGTGDTVQEALEVSKQEGEKDPILTKVPKDYGTYILPIP